MQKKRLLTSILASGLLAAMLPGVAAAQTEAAGTVTFGDNITCEFGQGSDAALAPCEMAEDGSALTLTFTNPQVRTGAFEGISVLDGELRANLAEATFESDGTVFFAGEVESCGSGTVYFDWAASGIQDETGGLIWDAITLTTVPGGTLAVTATIDETETNVAVPNGDGSSTHDTAVSYSCDAA